MIEIEGKILVLGVGNILLRDEGVGVKVVEELMRDYEFTDNVVLMDGGCRGMILTDPITQCESLVVIDAVLNDQPPGTLYRLEGDDLAKSLAFKNSMHDMDLLETLTCCELIGHRPPAVAIGIEPKDFQTEPNVELSDVIQAKVPEIIEKVLKEIEALGGGYTKKAA